MRKAALRIGALALVSVLAACGDKKEPNANPEQQMNSIMEATSPFADAEIQMNDAMMKAVGANVGDTWVRKMIEHHKGAIEMSRRVLTMNPKPDVARMARATIDKQTSEVAALQKLVTQGPPDHASADLFQEAMDKMHQAMMSATGADLSETYLRKMLEHHKGAVTMSEVALAKGVTGAVRAEIEKTKADQQMESRMVEAMLAGQSMEQAKEQATATPARAAGGTGGATPSKGMPVPGTRTLEHIAHDMNDMGNMDMNHMNHM